MTDHPSPVTNYENQAVHGLAKCAEPVFDMEMAKLAALRERQAAYQESLPTSLADCIAQADELLRQVNDDYPGVLEKALLCATALHPLINNLADDYLGQNRRSAHYLIDEVIDYLQVSIEVHDRLSDVLDRLEQAAGD